MATISFLLPTLGGGGAERVSVDLAREFHASGHRVEFALLSLEGALIAEAGSFAEIISLNLSRIRYLPFGLRRYISCRRPDWIVVSMWPLTALVPCLVRFFGFSTKVLVSEHCIISEQYRWRGWGYHVMMKLFAGVGYRCAHRRVGVSRAIIRDISRIAMLPQHRFNLVFNPLRRFNLGFGGDAPLVTWPPYAKIRILSVGNLSRVKNHALLLKAVHYLRSYSAHLIILGEGEQRDRLIKLIELYDLTKYVQLPGFIENPGPYYKSCDIFALSSDYEGFGNVLVEALSFGRRVISTNCLGGPREILAEGEFGRLVPVGDPLAMAIGIVREMSRPPDASLLRIRASHFSCPNVANRYLALMDIKTVEVNA